MTEPSHAPSFVRSRSGVVFLGFGAIAAYFLLREHWSHALGFLPFGLLLLCPLMHVFHRHGGHDAHGGGGHSNHDSSRSPLGDAQAPLPGSPEGHRASEEGGDLHA